MAYHVCLLRQAGLVDAAVRNVTGFPSPIAILNSVTWSGHEFADAARDDVLWKKATRTVLKEGASFTFDLISTGLGTRPNSILVSLLDYRFSD